MIVRSFRTRQRTRENIESTSECSSSDWGIRNNLWEMPQIWWIFVGRTGGIFWNSPAVHEYWITAQHKYNGSIVAHCYFYSILILAAIFFNNQCFTSLLSGTIEKDYWFKGTSWDTETITWLSNQIISIELCVYVVDFISHLMKSQSNQQHRIHQQRKDAGSPPCICWYFEPGMRMKMNSTVVRLNLWYLTKLQWYVS